MTRLNDKKQDEVRELFERVRRVTVEAPPYLETRVLAGARERQGRRLRFWKRLALSSTVGSVVLMLGWGSWFLRDTAFVAAVGQPFIVKIAMQPLKDSAIAKVRIQLPPGVFFDLEQYPELAQAGELTLRWSALDKMPELPVVLRADHAGRRKVRVSFLDADSRVLFVKVFELNVREG